MRISEALALQLDDVTKDGLLIRETKFQKSRLLPLHATTQQALDKYLATRATFGCMDRALFVSGSGGPLSYNTVRGVFDRLRRSVDLDGVSSPRKPHIHDLRQNAESRKMPSHAA
jgi:integrase